MSGGIKFDGGRELEKVRAENPLLASLLSKMIDASNRLAKNLGGSTQGELPPPPPVDTTSVKGTLAGNVLTAPGEILHFVHTHNSPLQRGIQYITEVDTDPNFPNPHALTQSTSRSGSVNLPAKNDNGDAVGYYLRVTPQMPGSGPQKPTVFGGLQGPTKIVMTGSTQMSLLQSQSSGTAKPGQGGQGLGAVLQRGPVGVPKRNLLTVK